MAGRVLIPVGALPFVYIYYIRTDTPSRWFGYAYMSAQANKERKKRKKGEKKKGKKMNIERDLNSGRLTHRQ